MPSRPSSGIRTRAKDGRSRRPTRSPARRPKTGPEKPADKEKRLDHLRKQCTDTKRLINGITEENMRNRTRLMALDKELNKRERLLQTMLKLTHANLGLGPEIVEKLREERNVMLPLYRKKAQDLHQQIADRENDHKAMKREPLFTRIIEQQVEFVSWKQEALRLESVQEDEKAKKEAEVYQRRVKALRKEISLTKEQLGKAQGELEDEKAWLESAREQSAQKADMLSSEQSVTRAVAIQYKGLIQTRKEVDRLQNEIEAMELERKKDQEELEALQSRLDTTSGAEPDRYTITGAALSAKPVMDEGLKLLRRAKGRESPRPLFSCLLQADEDQDGLLSLPELAEATSKWHGCPLEPGEAARLLFRLASRGQDIQHIRWLDALVLLDGLGPSSCADHLPDLHVLRWACLRQKLFSEELLRQLLMIDCLQRAEAFFGGSGLQLPHSDAAAWVQAWQQQGSERLMLLLPLGEATLSSEAMAAWWSRAKGAVQKNREELQKSFTVWRPDMLLRPDQFRMVCGEVLGLDLSEEDVEDLLLFFSSSFPSSGSREAVDGRKLLNEFA